MEGMAEMTNYDELVQRLETFGSDDDDDTEAMDRLLNESAAAIRELQAKRSEIYSAYHAAKAKLAELQAQKPVAWLCKFVEESGETREQVELENPEGFRWNDIGEPSPYSATPLYAKPVPAVDQEEKK